MSKVVIILTGVFLFFAGLGVGKELVQYTGFLFAASLLFLSVLPRGRVIFPRGFVIYLIFLIFIALNTFWSSGRKESLEYLVLFSSGGAFWLAFFNFKDKVSKYFGGLIIGIGAVFGILFFLGEFSGVLPGVYWNLFSFTSIERFHNHLGDLWAVVMVVLFYYLVKQRKKWTWFVIPFGTYFLLISLSRSSYVALAAGILFISSKSEYHIKNKIYWLFIATTIALFLYAGSQKTTLYSRAYFIQAVEGIIKYPFGVGVGNFALVSLETKSLPLGIEAFSSLAHNIVLEIFVGMGIFGLIFVAWLVKIVKSFLADKEDRHLLPQAVFITLGVNFLFDYTYFIPTMLWLWFISLGLSYSETESVPGFLKR